MKSKQNSHIYNLNDNFWIGLEIGGYLRERSVAKLAVELVSVLKSVSKSIMQLHVIHVTIAIPDHHEEGEEEEVGEDLMKQTLHLLLLQSQLARLAQVFVTEADWSLLHFVDPSLLCVMRVCFLQVLVKPFFVRFQV